LRTDCQLKQVKSFNNKGLSAMERGQSLLIIAIVMLFYQVDR
jgi:hypothetical protein